MDKTKHDLAFARSLRDYGRLAGWRVVVYGGYGLDLALGRITRHHGDLDLVIYGQMARGEARKKLTRFIHSQAENAVMTVKPDEFFLDIKVKYPRFVGNFYYTQTVRDPFDTLQEVVKMNGQIVKNSPARFPPPAIGTIGDLTIEIQDQGAHLADILYKKGSNQTPSKHDQDIVNLQMYLREKK